MHISFILVLFIDKTSYTYDFSINIWETFKCKTMEKPLDVKQMDPWATMTVSTSIQATAIYDYTSTLDK